MLNQCNFIGRLGRDPESIDTRSGVKIAKFSLGVSEKYKDDNGNNQERTEWVNCISFGKLAEVVGRYLHKGALVYVTGKFRTKKWQAQDGTDRYSVEINVLSMVMLDTKRETTQARAHEKPQENPHPGYTEDGEEIPF